MQEQLQRIEDKISSVQVDVARNTVSLELHVKRTDVAERRLERLEQLLAGLAVAGVLGGVLKLLIG